MQFAPLEGQRGEGGTALQEDLVSVMLYYLCVF